MVTFALLFKPSIVPLEITLGNHPKAANDNHLKTGQR